MIATFIDTKVIKSGARRNFDRTQHELHIVAWVGRAGMLKVGLVGYCGAEGDPGKGTIQVQDAVFEKGGHAVIALSRATAMLQRLGIEISPVPCEKCAAMAGLVSS